MPNSTSVRIPSYRVHKPTGQAVVTLGGRDVYLGKHGTAASRQEYRRLTAEWLGTGGETPHGEANDLTIAEMVIRYWRFAQRHYRAPSGARTSELNNVAYAIKPLRQIYGHTLVKEFGPLALKTLQRHLIDQNLSRGVINSRIDRVRRVFRWAVSEEIAPPNLAHALTTVAGLRRGRSDARETEPVQPVRNALLEATLPHLPSVVAAMVLFQRLTGCRPAEVCILRPCDVDMDGKVWKYNPQSHKTQHHGRRRIIFVGPKAQQIIRPYLLRDKTAFCFSPIESEHQRRAELHAVRRTPLSCGNRPGTNRRGKSKRRLGDRYDTSAYLRAIERACDRAFPPPKQLLPDELKAWRRQHRWSPNRLRHAAATEIRARFGLEAAATVLGHAKADVTQIYAERDFAKAESIMHEVG